MSGKKSRVPLSTPSGWSKRIGALLSFVLGTICGLFIQQWFVGLLPGPEVTATLSGLHVATGNAAGCTSYSLIFHTDSPLEYVYAKVQLPTNVVNYRVGFPVEAEMAGSGRTSMQAWELGRDATGRCIVVQAAVSNEADVQSAAAGNMIAIHASKLPSQTTIMGVVATSDSESSANPAPDIYTEGAYEYLKLGQVVRKPLEIVNSGVSNTK